MYVLAMTSVGGTYSIILLIITSYYITCNYYCNYQLLPVIILLVITIVQLLLSQFIHVVHFVLLEQFAGDKLFLNLFPGKMVGLPEQFLSFSENSKGGGVIQVITSLYLIHLIGIIIIIRHSAYCYYHIFRHACIYIYKYINIINYILKAYHLQIHKIIFTYLVGNVIYAFAYTAR